MSKLIRISGLDQRDNPPITISLKDDITLEKARALASALQYSVSYGIVTLEFTESFKVRTGAENDRS